MARILHRVPLIAQKHQYSCWIESYRMVEAWYLGLGLDRAKISRETLLRFAGGEVPLREDRINAFALKVGLTVFKRPATPEEVTKLVSTYGPLWYPGLVHNHKAPTSGHVVVITGMENQDICFNDPFPVGLGEQDQLFDASVFFGEYLRPIGDPAPFLVMLKGS